MNVFHPSVQKHSADLAGGCKVTCSFLIACFCIDLFFVQLQMITNTIINKAACYRQMLWLSLCDLAGSMVWTRLISHYYDNTSTQTNPCARTRVWVHHCQRAHKTSAEWWNLSSPLYWCCCTSRFLFAIKPLLQTNLMRWRLNTLLLIAFQNAQLPPALRLLASATWINSSYRWGRLTAGSRCSLGVLGSCFSYFSGRPNATCRLPCLDGK